MGAEAVRGAPVRPTDDQLPVICGVTARFRVHECSQKTDDQLVRPAESMSLLVERLTALDSVNDDWVPSERLSTLDIDNDDWVRTLRGDVGARVSKAFQGGDRFGRWGKHYLRAFLRAHQLQRCTNFLDKSLQVYGGNLFRALREEGDSVFVSLPPPVPSRRTPARPANQTSTQMPSVHTPAPNMNVYYGGSGGG